MLAVTCDSLRLMGFHHLLLKELALHTFTLLVDIFILLDTLELRLVVIVVSVRRGTDCPVVVIWRRLGV